MSSALSFAISRKLIRRIRISRTGWAFIALTLAIGIAGLNTGNNLLYLIFGMLLSMILTNAILSTASLHNLEAQFYFPERLYAGKNNPVKIVICNKKRKLPSFALTIIPQLGDGSYFIFKIDAASTVTLVHYQNFPARGRHPLPQYNLLTSYPFGLIEKQIPIRLKLDRVIYPAISRISQQHLSHSSSRGEFLSGDKGVGVNPYGIREYHPGDEVRFLHWRSFAKMGKWMVKEFELEKKSKITLHLMVSPKQNLDPKRKDLRERAIALTASLLMHFIEENRQVGLIINNQWMNPQDGSGYIDFFLTTLALFDSDPSYQNLPSGLAQDPKQLGSILAIHDAGPIPKNAHFDLVAPPEWLTSIELPL